MAHARPGQAIRQTVHGDLNVSLVGSSSKFSKPETEDEMLTVPGGPRRASDIHYIPPGLCWIARTRASVTSIKMVTLLPNLAP